MKKIEGSWCVYFKEAPGENHPVVRYMNFFHNNIFGAKVNDIWYGEDSIGQYVCTKDMRELGSIRILTKQEFLKLTNTMTKEEIENYKDFKKGDILVKASVFCKVVEVLGDIIFRTNIVSSLENIPFQPFNLKNTSAKEDLYSIGWRLHVLEEKPAFSIEVTLADIAKKYGVSPEQLKIKY